MLDIAIITFFGMLVAALALALQRAKNRAEQAESNLSAAMHLIARYERLLADERAEHAERIVPGGTLHSN